MKSVDEAMDNPTPKKSSANAEQTAMMVEVSMKLDKVLKYQKRAARVAMFRGFVSFVFLFVFIVLPIIASVYLVDYVKQNYDLSAIQSLPGQLQQMQGQVQQLQNLGGQFDINSVIQQIQGQ